jgi:hypothetical protein
MNRKQWIGAAAAVAVLGTGIGVMMVTSGSSRPRRVIAATQGVVTSPASHTITTVAASTGATNTTVTLDGVVPADEATTVAVQGDPPTTTTDSTTTLPADTTTSKTSTIPIARAPFATTVTISCAGSTLALTVSANQPVPPRSAGSPGGELVVEWNGNSGDAMPYPLNGEGSGLATATASVQAGASTAMVTYNGYAGVWEGSSASAPTC